MHPFKSWRNVDERSPDCHARLRSRHPRAVPAGEPLAGLAGRRGRAGPRAGRTRHHPCRCRRGDRARGAAGTAGPRAHRRGLRPHRPHHRAAGLGAVPRGRRAARRLGALGCDDAEHHPDRRSAGAAPGAWRVPPPDRRGADRDGRSRRARRGHADGRPHARPARGAGHVRLQGRGLDRRAAAPCRTAAPGRAAAVRRHAGRRRRDICLAGEAGAAGAGGDRPAARLRHR